ncbi:hypothetical protein [Palaeococcus sp. (in: euryarchaeotes)]
MEEVARLLRLRDELLKRISIMEAKYGQALKDQEMLLATIEKLREENRRLMVSESEGG